MTISGFVAYVKQAWKNKPDTSTPLSAARLTHVEEGVKANSDAIAKIAASVINQQANDANKIPSSALMYSVNEKVDSAISDLTVEYLTDTNIDSFYSANKPRWGKGYNMTNAPWEAPSVVEFMPYDTGYGVQRITMTQKNNGVYSSAWRSFDNGIWSGWVDDTRFNVQRNNLVSNTSIDFNQIALVKENDAAPYTLHFYKDYNWITSFTLK